MSAHRFAPGPGRDKDRCARCGCAETEAVHGGISAEALTRRMDRLAKLDVVETMMLLSYLDGRAPEYIDEWFERRRIFTGSVDSRG